MRSIRRFLIIVLLATVTLVNFLAALHGYRSSLAAAEKLFDEQLLQIAMVFSSGLDDTEDLTSGVSATAIAFQVWDGAQLLQHSDNVPTTPIAPFATGFHEVNFNNARWRVAVLNESNERWIQVAERIDSRYVLAENVINQSVLPLVFSVPLLGLLIWLIVSWGLLPLRNLAQQLQQKHPEDLSSIRNIADTKELRQLVASVNSLLKRLDSALERESRFAANAAHELRTPLSVLKVHLYNLKEGKNDNREGLSNLEQGIERLSHLIEQIQALHLSAQDRRNQLLKPIDLSALCRDAISDNFSLISLKHQSIELGGEERLMLEANAQSLRIMLDNLLTNASKYTPANGSIYVSVEENDKMAEIRVEDSGPGIVESEREQVFERFYRVGGDHHNSGESGCGLGLSIVRQVVESHGASITLSDSKKLGGLCVTVRFPKQENNK